MKGVLVYSMGSLDEDHGPALPRQIDDITAIKTVALVCERTGFSYRGHLPFSSDRVGEIARDWCPAFTEPEKAVEGIIEYIRHDLSTWPARASHIVIISGHGGNNFLKGQEKQLSDSIGVPVLYVIPFEGVKAFHKEYGEIEVEHANTGDHSVAAYMGLLDEKGLRMINELAARDSRKALENWKPLCRLGWYVLFGGPRYEPLRNPAYGLEEEAKRFLNERRIIADPELGRELFNQNLEKTLKQVQDFTS
jgi:creatinine amidohydrolase/Fe(II)-dependent formamide hydrolase-like protein